MGWLSLSAWDCTTNFSGDQRCLTGKITVTGPLHSVTGPLHSQMLSGREPGLQAPPPVS